ncbi:MAG: glutamine cyclotransferase [Pirellulaceae bacterium]|nr:MAG: glutamine cyclotransferase [Pirellulaceae bacterium]
MLIKANMAMTWPAWLPRRRIMIMAVAVVGLLSAGGIFLAYQIRSSQPALYTYEVLQQYPHDSRAYCQGLVYADGELLEGTGQYGRSELRRVRLETGEVLQSIALAPEYFGEGIAVYQDRIYQLTWRENVCFVYDKRTLTPTGRTFRYSGEGWGLTTDGKWLIMSDGTSVLRFLDPDTFRVVRRVAVTENGRRVRNLNELEFVKGLIYANVWKEDYLVQIDPHNGRVVGRIDLRGLRPGGLSIDSEEVLNGIAYDQENDRLLVTGKNWPRLYHIRLVPANR